MLTAKVYAGANEWWILIKRKELGPHLFSFYIYMSQQGHTWLNSSGASHELHIREIQLFKRAALLSYWAI